MPPHSHVFCSPRTSENRSYRLGWRRRSQSMKSKSRCTFRPRPAAHRNARLHAACLGSVFPRTRAKYGYKTLEQHGSTVGTELSRRHDFSETMLSRTVYTLGTSLNSNNGDVAKILPFTGRHISHTRYRKGLALMTASQGVHLSSAASWQPCAIHRMVITKRVYACFIS